MKNPINKCGQILLSILMAVFILISAVNSTFAQKGVGAKYGARDPHTCADASQPKAGAISAEKAREYVFCTEHTTGNNLYLVDEVTIQQVGKARPYNVKEDYNLPSIDVTHPVYPIRGSLKLYQCSLVSDYMENTGKNCFVYDHPNAKGICYKDSFSNWNCTFADAASELIAKGAAPPGAAKQPNQTADKKVGQNPQSQNNEQPTENKKETAEKDENGYPKPNLSEMSKWYEITKIEPGDPATAQETKFLFKPKIEHYGRSRVKFEARYLDKDGALVASYPVWVEYSTEIGEIGKGSIPTPSEKEMGKVTTIKITRIKE